MLEVGVVHFGGEVGHFGFGGLVLVEVAGHLDVRGEDVRGGLLLLISPSMCILLRNAPIIGIGKLALKGKIIERLVLRDAVERGS